MTAFLTFIIYVKLFVIPVRYYYQQQKNYIDSFS